MDQFQAFQEAVKKYNLNPKQTEELLKIVYVKEGSSPRGMIGESLAKIFILFVGISAVLAAWHMAALGHFGVETAGMPLLAVGSYVGRNRDRPITHEALRQVNHKVDSGLLERRWIINAQKIILQSILAIERNNFDLKEEQRLELQGKLEEVLETMVKPGGTIRVSEKKSARAFLKKAIKILSTDNGSLLDVRSNLISSNNSLYNRRQKIGRNVKKAFGKELRGLHEYIQRRNEDIKKRLAEIETFNNRRFYPGVEKNLLGIQSLGRLKGEPDLSFFHQNIADAIKDLERNNWNVTPGVKLAREQVKLSTQGYRLGKSYLEELIKEELTSDTEVIRRNVLRKVISKHFREEHMDYPEQARARALGWAQTYKNIFIPLHVDNLEDASERISNPGFQAADFYQFILGFKTVDEALAKKHTTNREKTATFLQTLNKRVRRENLQGLVAAITQDFNLDEMQSSLLEGIVWNEPRSPLGESHR